MLRRQATTIKNWKIQDRAPVPFAEPFLWRVAEVIATVGLAMERGHIDAENDVPAPGWKQIVHRDIKPDNIFLDDLQIKKLAIGECILHHD